MIICRYKIQQDQGQFCLKGCPDGDLTDYGALAAALTVLRNIEYPSMEVKMFLRNLKYIETPRPPSKMCPECKAVGGPRDGK